MIELSQQNTQLEEEALSLEQKLGEAENSVEEGQKKVCSARFCYYAAVLLSFTICAFHFVILLTVGPCSSGGGC